MTSILRPEDALSAISNPAAAQAVTAMIEAEMTAINARMDALKQLHATIQGKTAGG